MNSDMNITLGKEWMDEQMELYHQNMIQEEKSDATIDKYLRDIRSFLRYVDGKEITKESVVEYKKHLQDLEYADRSINSMIASVNGFIDFLGLGSYKAKFLKLQREVYSKEERELTKAEYMRLLKAAENNKKLQLAMQTICGTGIRVSELHFFTVEAVKKNEVTVKCKGKTRMIMIPGKIRKQLLDYAKQQKIKSGEIFLSTNGKSLDRKRIWAQMKALCKSAKVNPEKVFPHNLRKLFARTFYRLEKDIAKLADVLGHSSIDTTRIYIMTTGSEHRKLIERLGLVI